MSAEFGSLGWDVPCEQLYVLLKERGFSWAYKGLDNLTHNCVFMSSIDSMGTKLSAIGELTGYYNGFEFITYLGILEKSSIFDLMRFLLRISPLSPIVCLYSRSSTSKRWRILPNKVVSKVTWSGQVIFWNGTPLSLWSMCRRPLTAPTSARCATVRMCTAVTGRSCSELSTKVRQHVLVNFELFLSLFALFPAAFASPANTHGVEVALGCHLTLILVFVGSSFSFWD